MAFWARQSTKGLLARALRTCSRGRTELGSSPPQSVAALSTSSSENSSEVQLNSTLLGFAAAATACVLCTYDSHRSGARRVQCEGRVGGDGGHSGLAEYMLQARRDLMPIWESLDAELKRELESSKDFYNTKRYQIYKETKGVKVSVKGKMLSVRFPVRPGADTSSLVVDVVGALSRRKKGSGHIQVESWDSAVAKQLSFYDKDGSDKALRMMLFTPLLGNGLQEIEFMKEGPLSEEDVKIIVSAVRSSVGVSVEYQEVRKVHQMRQQSSPEDMGDFAVRSNRAPAAGKRVPLPNRRKQKSFQGEMPRDDRDEVASAVVSSIEEELNGLGARVFLPPDSAQGRENALKLCRKEKEKGLSGGDTHRVNGLLWGNIAGYDKQKREIEDSLLLNLLQPNTLVEIAKGTREHYISNLPKAVLFDGPPGTGKTSCARALAAMAVIPLVYVPVESITSKYYGESEKILSQIFQRCSSFKEGCIVFIDEIDSLITSRESEMHEASRRILGVLLKEVDGFEEGSHSVVIAATNRKQDLDLALLNRFDTIIHFELPDAACRAKILQKYAKHLGKGQLAELGELTEGMSGRDLKDICLQAERRWASKIVRGEVKKWSLPPFETYVRSCEQRKGQKH